MRLLGFVSTGAVRFLSLCVVRASFVLQVVSFGVLAAIWQSVTSVRHCVNASGSSIFNNNPLHLIPLYLPTAPSFRWGLLVVYALSSIRAAQEPLSLDA